MTQRGIHTALMPPCVHRIVDAVGASTVGEAHIGQCVVVCSAPFPVASSSQDLASRPVIRRYSGKMVLSETVHLCTVSHAGPFRFPQLAALMAALETNPNKSRVAALPTYTRTSSRSTANAIALAEHLWYILGNQ